MFGSSWIARSYHAVAFVKSFCLWYVLPMNKTAEEFLGSKASRSRLVPVRFGEIAPGKCCFSRKHGLFYSCIFRKLDAAVFRKRSE